MNRSRLLHALFTLTAFAVVWLVTAPALADDESSHTRISRSASASFAPLATQPPPPALQVPVGPSNATSRAPLCDPRGAIMFAPPPQMQDVEASLDTGLTLDDCFGPDARDAALRHASPGRAPSPLDASSASSDAAVLATAVALAASARELLPVPVAGMTCPRPGFRSTVDRPPRA